MYSPQIDIHDQHQPKGNSSMMDVPVLMLIDIRHFTQSGVERSVTGSPGSSGTSSTPSVTDTSVIDITNPLLAKRSNKLTSFVVALNKRDYTGSRTDPKGRERKDTPTVSALVPMKEASPGNRLKQRHRAGRPGKSIGCSHRMRHSVFPTARHA
jgi:hypothetical protein